MMNAATLTFTLLACVALGSGCADNQSPTAASTTAVVTTTELFAGTLAAQGSSFYAYTVSQSGTVSVTLASVTAANRSVAGTTLGLGIGIPAGMGCSATMSMNAVAALTAQLVSEAAAGVYCVNLVDVGNVVEPVNFAVRIVHP